MSTQPSTPDSAHAAARAACLAPHEGERLRLVGENMRILADTAATGGRCLIFENTTPPGGGPPLHRHGVDDECFFILEGRFRFVLDGREFIAEPGAFVVAPRGSLHTFANLGAGPGRMLVVTTPSGLERAFREAHAAEQAGAVSPEALAAIFAKHQLTIHGPPIGAGGG